MGVMKTAVPNGRARSLDAKRRCRPHTVHTWPPWDHVSVRRKEMTQMEDAHTHTHTEIDRIGLDRMGWDGMRWDGMGWIDR